MMTPAKTPSDASQRRRIFEGVFLKKGMGHGTGRQMGPIAEVGMSSATKVSRQQKNLRNIHGVLQVRGGMRENVGYPELYSGYKEKELNLILKFLEIGLWNGLIFRISKNLFMCTKPFLFLVGLVMLFNSMNLDVNTGCGHFGSKFPVLWSFNFGFLFPCGEVLKNLCLSGWVRS